MIHSEKRYLLSLAAVLLMFVASACDTNGPETTTQEPDPQRFDMEGALNEVFEEETADFSAFSDASDLNLGRQQLIRFFIQEIVGQERRRVDAILQLLIPSDMRLLTPGTYRFEGGDLNARVSYDVLRTDSTQARTFYLFEGTSINLQIEQADLDGIRGRFTLEANQTVGQRTENDMTEEVELPNDGVLLIESRFNITDIRVR